MPAKSKAQQRFFGVVRGIQKGSSKGSKEAKKVAKDMKQKDVEDFASTKHKGLPNKVKKEQRVRSLIRKMVREIMKEDFAGAHPQHKRKKFDKMRQKQSEVLGYKLMGTPDIKTEIDDATVKEGKLTEAKETIFDVAARVMKDKQAYGYKTKKGLVKVDMQTANLLTKVFKKVNPKMKKILSDLGYKSPTQLMNTLWAVVK
jgi:hypothetical protein